MVVYRNSPCGLVYTSNSVDQHVLVLDAAITTPRPTTFQLMDEASGLSEAIGEADETAGAEEWKFTLANPAVDAMCIFWACVIYILVLCVMAICQRLQEDDDNEEVCPTVAIY